MFMDLVDPTAWRMGEARLASLVLVSCLLVGCGTESQVSVSGTVTFQGQPATEGDITFFKPTTGEVAQGPLGVGGAYTLLIPEKGISPGDYKVIVTPKRSYEKVAGREGSEYKMVEQGGKSIPKRYRDRTASPLKATLEAGENTVDFDMEKK